MSVTINSGYTRGLEYENPFLDMTSCSLPKRIKSILHLIAGAVLPDSITSICVRKGAEYPITDLLYEGTHRSALKDDSIEKKWKYILEDNLDIIRSLKQSNMDEIGYGNSFVSINYPFKRYLICPRCGKKHSVESLKCRFRGYKYFAKCKTKKCGYSGVMGVKDVDSREIKKLSFVHWDILRMDIKYNNITDKHIYYYTPPAHIINSVKMGDLDIINDLRWEIIEACSRVYKQLRLSDDNIFHFKREGMQYLIPSERGWGIPGPMSVLRDIFHCRLLKKGNEMIAFEHIVPLRILFPQANGNESPHEIVNLEEWKQTIEDEIIKYKSDPNRISILPIPLGIINMGGDAKLLLVTQEIKIIEDDIISGMGFAPEIIKGNAQWSGSSVSLRVVENTFMNTRASDQKFIDWSVEKLSRYFRIAPIDIKMSDFKMSDDIQQKQFMRSLSEGQDPAISKRTLTKAMGQDPKEEYQNKLEDLRERVELQKEEIIAQAEASGEAQIVQAQFQADAENTLKLRSEYNMRADQESKMEYEVGEQQQRAAEVHKETSDLAKAYGLHPQQVSTKKFIESYTKQFSDLFATDPDQASLYLLKLKNDMPAFYSEVYANLREKNVIKADLTPNLERVQAETPGEIPQNVQGEVNAETPPSVSEQPGGENNPVVQPNPEQKPPNREGGSPM